MIFFRHKPYPVNRILHPHPDRTLLTSEEVGPVSKINNYQLTILGIQFSYSRPLTMSRQIKGYLDKGTLS